MTSSPGKKKKSLGCAMFCGIYGHSSSAQAADTVFPFPDGMLRRAGLSSLSGHTQSQQTEHSGK